MKEMTEELDKLEAALTDYDCASDAILGKHIDTLAKAARAHLAAQRQAVNAEIPNVNFLVYGYLDKKALKANERERDLLAGFYFYLQECGFLAAERQGAERYKAADTYDALKKQFAALPAPHRKPQRMRGLKMDDVLKPIDPRFIVPAYCYSCREEVRTVGVLATHEKIDVTCSKCLAATDEGLPEGFAYATSAELFQELGASKPEAEKIERELNATMRRTDMKVVPPANKTEGEKNG